MNDGTSLLLRMGVVVMLTGSSLPISATAAAPVLLEQVPSDAVVDIASLQWVAPRFSADAAERARWDSLLAWARGPASEAETKRLREAFADRGVDASALPHGCYGNHRCALVVSAEATAADVASLDAFVTAARQAQPYVATYRQVATAVDAIHKVRDDADSATKDAKELGRRFAQDQVLRYAFDSLPGHGEEAIGTPTFALYAFALEADLRLLDDSNILYAEEQIARYGGWPAPPRISEDMQQQLWALVQHGDHRPELQYDALQALQRSYEGRALPRQYAFLHDRVMLKLTGRQRYGTQVTCVDGKRVAQPLDGSGDVDALRTSVGMDSLADYLKDFPSCTAAP
ncbi:hypothetical protein FHY11_001016 [Xanthomonas arboricola]|uniref:DUF6624 domain-containing protein n=1 Tax=Xanthomonas euroxanthea TaxID=2259622 RepID=UPI00141BC6F9|nr:DUF6624 domain-containing protein [Xanthomonas euroxanthea]NIK07550.1 hypothetical protein [Xanthomonas euroxanthea]